MKKELNELEKNKDNNNLTKCYSITYLKTYCYYYVEIYSNHSKKCNFGKINEVFNDEKKIN